MTINKRQKIIIVLLTVLMLLIGNIYVFATECPLNDDKCCYDCGNTCLEDPGQVYDICDYFFGPYVSSTSAYNAGVASSGLTYRDEKIKGNYT